VGGQSNREGSASQVLLPSTSSAAASTPKARGRQLKAEGAMPAKARRRQLSPKEERGRGFHRLQGC